VNPGAHGRAPIGEDARMLKPVLVVVAALLVPGTALAQTPDTTPPDVVVQINTALNSVDSMIGNGLTFSVDPSEDLTYTASATIKVKKKKVTVAKSIREGQVYNGSDGFVEQSIPRGSDSAVKQLIKIKKGTKTAVTLTLVLKDTAGNTKTVTKTVKLKKRY
jgi:hypothetical protein